MVTTDAVTTRHPEIWVAFLFEGDNMLYDYGGRMLDIMKEKNITENDLQKKTKIASGDLYAFLWYNLPIDFITFEKMLKVIDVSVVKFFEIDKTPIKISEIPICKEKKF